MPGATLVCHPDSPDTAVRRIEASVSRDGDTLAVTWLLEGDLERLRIPAWREREAGDRLWEHTCFEIFVRGQARISTEQIPKFEPGPFSYHELNFSPSGAWAAYAFARYREGSPLADGSLDPRIAVRRRDGALELEAAVALERLSPDYAGAPLAIAVSAVIENDKGALSYWALAHPAGKPDFHHPDSFVIYPSARSRA